MKILGGSLNSVTAFWYFIFSSSDLFEKTHQNAKLVA